MKGTNGWSLQIAGTSKTSLESWLLKEAEGIYQIVEDQGNLEIHFSTISDAFRFRLQFDDEILKTQ